MLNLKKIAVTGGLASGKSSVCQILQSLGAYIVRADDIVHRLLSSDSLIRQQILSLLGSDILTNNQLDREKIANKVFSHPDKLRILESILHPKVFEEIERQYEKIKSEKHYPLFVVEVPLLYETQTEDLFDIVIMVYAEEKQCFQRFTQRKNQNKEEFYTRNALQLTQESKAAKASFVIKNQGSLEQLKEEVSKLFSTLCSI